MSLRKMWLRRQTTKFNGVSYPVQRAAAAVFTEEGLRECRRSLRVYQSNARQPDIRYFGRAGYLACGREEFPLYLDGMPRWALLLGIL